MLDGSEKGYNHRHSLSFLDYCKNANKYMEYAEKLYSKYHGLDWFIFQSQRKKALILFSEEKTYHSKLLDSRFCLRFHK